jgi:hypothetical protein
MPGSSGVLVAQGEVAGVVAIALLADDYEYGPSL